MRQPPFRALLLKPPAQGGGPSLSLIFLHPLHPPPHFAQLLHALSLPAVACQELIPRAGLLRCELVLAPFSSCPRRGPGTHRPLSRTHHHLTARIAALRHSFKLGIPNSQRLAPADDELFAGYPLSHKVLAPFPWTFKPAHRGTITLHDMFTVVAHGWQGQRNLRESTEHLLPVSSSTMQIFPL